MIADVTRAGGVVVLRGLTHGCGKGHDRCARPRARSPASRSRRLGIDPRLFRAFGIEAVPAYVVAASDFDLCDGFDCTTPCRPTTA